MLQSYHILWDKRKEKQSKEKKVKKKKNQGICQQFQSIRDRATGSKLCTMIKNNLALTLGNRFFFLSHNMQFLKHTRQIPCYLFPLSTSQYRLYSHFSNCFKTECGSSDFGEPIPELYSVVMKSMAAQYETWIHRANSIMVHTRYNCIEGSLNSANYCRMSFCIEGGKKNKAHF